ncbi:hypothetical protein [Rasiella sp. SM2506]|uniref:hypothetical protein n=1 Tax=Rasiella sp. SM2506 TaxID=3423914 RepID=UPI003D7A0846
MEYTLSQIQTELEKRVSYRYQWQQKQNDIWDGYTAFIYETLCWETLLECMKQAVATEKLEKGKLFDYAANRWFNFWSAVGVEQIFAALEGVEKVKNRKDSEKDFYLNGIAFDHKTSVFPRRFPKDFTSAFQYKKELIAWFYEHQSTQNRHHLKNRLFIVVHATNGAHWKLKSKLDLLQTEITKYVNNFSEAQLQSLTFANGETALSDIIWVQE